MNQQDNDQRDHIKHLHSRIVHSFVTVIEVLTYLSLVSVRLIVQITLSDYNAVHVRSITGIFLLFLPLLRLAITKGALVSCGQMIPE